MSMDTGCFMAEILPIQRKTLSTQINQSTIWASCVRIPPWRLLCSLIFIFSHRAYDSRENIFTIYWSVSVFMFWDLICTDCPKGKYGQQCKENCSMHCRVLGECDKVTGHCLRGCQAGWKTPWCDQSKILSYSL